MCMGKIVEMLLGCRAPGDINSLSAPDVDQEDIASYLTF